MSNLWHLEHPIYSQFYEDWVKWRYAYNGGKDFVEQYLKPFSSRETETDFLARKNVSYSPSFAKSAINDIKNSIYQRLVDITREGGTVSFQEAVDSNVDMAGSSMNFFMGTKVLPELLPMKRVGVYVDMPEVPDTLTLNESSQFRPYLYLYRTEDIKCWCYDSYPRHNQLTSLLLKECIYSYDEQTGLPNGTYEVLKHYQLIDGVVRIDIYNEKGDLSDGKILNISRIPFVIFELPHSLMEDIADYQIALLNLASSDISYALRSNFPFYVEQFDPRAESPHLKTNTADTTLDLNTTSGRRYPVGTEQPAFIHPSSEPLLASMKKQDQLMTEIRLLVNLSVANLSPKMASAESKGMDQQSLESGLSAIGLILENGERQIGEIWSLYEGSREVPTIKYPEKYNLKSDEERRADCKQLDELLDTVPSKTYQREVCKMISDILLRNRIPDNLLMRIDKEIDQADVVNVDPDIILRSVEKGLVGLETASESLGFPEGEVEKAKEDHAERLARIAISQSEGAAAARGVGDLAGRTDGGKSEKVAVQQKDKDEVVKDKVRGDGN